VGASASSLGCLEKSPKENPKGKLKMYGFNIKVKMPKGRHRTMRSITVQQLVDAMTNGGLKYFALDSQPRLEMLKITGCWIPTWEQVTSNGRYSCE
jgi:hypothetical protein